MELTSFRFKPYNIEDTSTLTPDNPLFFSFQLNVAILTKYGRYIYIRHGNQERCSSFFATLATIVNKLELSFGKTETKSSEYVSAKLKVIKQGKTTFYLRRKENFMYICWTLTHSLHQLTIYSMLDFLHHQLTSSFTSQVSAVIDEDQSYDPTINFGKGRSQHQLLACAIANGLYSIPILLTALPVMPLPPAMRHIIYSILKEEKSEGLKVSVLMTMNEIICIHKKKEIDLIPYDVFLFSILLQSQSSLSKSEIWYPICLPGLEASQRVFCYMNHISEDIVHIMIADESNIFSVLSESSKALKSKLQQLGLFQKLNVNRNLIDDPTLERMTFTKHFVLRYSWESMNQFVMSNGNYFGRNEGDYLGYLNIYAHLLHHIATIPQNRKEMLHVEYYQGQMCGYYEEGKCMLMFVASKLCELDQCKGIIASLFKYYKEQEGTLFMTKIS